MKAWSGKSRWGHLPMIGGNKHWNCNSCHDSAFLTWHNELLTHWGRVTHICVGKLTIIDSDNGLSPGRHQAIIWTNAGILLIGPLGTNFNGILIGIQTFSFKKMHLKMASAKWRPFCLSLNALKNNNQDKICMTMSCLAHSISLRGYRWLLNQLCNTIWGQAMQTWKVIQQSLCNETGKVLLKHINLVIYKKNTCLFFLLFYAGLTIFYGKHCHDSQWYSVNQSCGHTIYFNKTIIYHPVQCHSCAYDWHLLTHWLLGNAAKISNMLIPNTFW